MYKVFADHPINEFEETERIREASIILISLEDRLYYERKGYTNYSFSVAKKIFDEHVQKTDIIKLSYLKYIMRTALSFLKKIIKNILLHDRGYSTIPMQLVRSLELERGYNCAFRRKIYEVIYSRIFFEGLKKYYEVHNYNGRQNIKRYLLYIYFYSVKTFFEETGFIDFIQALNYLEKNRMNVSDISRFTKEAIFIACMGLSKNADDLPEEKIDKYIGKIKGVHLEKSKINYMTSKKNKVARKKISA